VERGSDRRGMERASDVAENPVQKDGRKAFEELEAIRCRHSGEIDFQKELEVAVKDKFAVSEMDVSTIIAGQRESCETIKTLRLRKNAKANVNKYVCFCARSMCTVNAPGTGKQQE